MIDSPWNLSAAPAAALGPMSNKRQIEKASNPRFTKRHSGSPTRMGRAANGV